MMLMMLAMLPMMLMVLSNNGPLTLFMAVRVPEKMAWPHVAFLVETVALVCSRRLWYGTLVFCDLRPASSTQEP